MQEIPKMNNIQYIKVGHLYCQICVGIDLANLLRILLSKVTNEMSNLEMECGLNPSADLVPTVDDQPFLKEIRNIFSVLLRYLYYQLIGY